MTPSLSQRIAFLLFGSLASSDAVRADAPPDLGAFARAVGPLEARQTIAGVAARAEASGPRGAFLSEMLSLSSDTARFRLTKGGDSTELLLAGGTPFQRRASSASFEPADAALASFVRGHEAHRMLLDLERRFRPDARTPEPGCLALRGPDESPASICRAAGSELPLSIALELPPAAGGGTVTLEFGDWRSLPAAPEVRLPFSVAFVTRDERHIYRYAAVLPFRLAPGVALPENPDLLFARLDDLAALAAAHERVLEAHRRSDVALLLADAAERSLSSGRGTLGESGRSELAARLGPYLDSTQFSRYDDVVPPVLAVAADGSLGWVACQIEAEGTQAQPPEPARPIAFGFSWVELYARRDGRWLAIGNASSARP